MTVALRDEGRVVGFEAEEFGFICKNCMSLEEEARLDLFTQTEMEYREYVCSRCGKVVPAPPGSYLDL
jgi:hypothetical protein